MEYGSNGVAKQWSTGSAGTRTRNQRLKRALLYRLSYRPASKSFLIQIKPHCNTLWCALQGAVTQDVRNVSKSRSEFRGRSNRKIDKPAALAASQSRFWSLPTCRASLGFSFINLSARR